MDDRLSAALAFYDWLFAREFSWDEADQFVALARQAGNSNDQLSLNVVRHAVERWDELQASRGAIDRSAYLPEAVTLLRELDSRLCAWLVARYDEASPILVEADIALTPEIIDALFELRQQVIDDPEASPRAIGLFATDTLEKWTELTHDERERAARVPRVWMRYRVAQPSLQEQGLQVEFERLRYAFDDGGFLARPIATRFESDLSERIDGSYRTFIQQLMTSPDAADPLSVRPWHPIEDRTRPGFIERALVVILDDLKRRRAGRGRDEWYYRDILTSHRWPRRGPQAEPPDEGGTLTANGGGGSAPAAANGGGGLEEPEEVPETAYPLIACDEIVVAGQEFVLTVGLSEKVVEGVAGGEMTRPDRGRGAYKLTMRVIAPGMSLPRGESWKRTVEVSASNSYPTVELHVTPEPQADGMLPRKIAVDYSIGSQPMGIAERSLVVIRDESFRAQASVGPQEAVEFPMPPLEGAPHITVKIWDWANGEIRWTIDLADPLLSDIDVRDDTWFKDIGVEPEKFTTRLVSDLDSQVVGIEKTVRSYSRQVSDKVPDEFWPVLAEVRRRVKGPPSVLIMTQEPYLPWELAQVPEEYRDKRLGDVLGTHAAVARWVLAKRPPPPDTTAVDVKGIGVIAGLYQGNSQLKHAIAERRQMMSSYGASEVPARISPFINYLDKSTDQVIHFAVHGEYASSPSEDGIILEDGIVPQSTIDGSTLAAKPFIFINACKLGGSGKLLDEYSGMANAFIVAGGCGVIAPLWSIRDDISARVAREFYRAVFTENIPVAEALRRIRTKFMQRGYKSATCLAYLYYGHPALRLSR